MYDKTFFSKKKIAYCKSDFQPRENTKNQRVIDFKQIEKKTICFVVYSFWKLWHDYHLLPSRDDSIVLGSGHEYSKKQQQNKQLPTSLVEERNHEKVSISLLSKILVIPTQLARDWVYLFLSVLNHGRICAPNYVGSVFVWRVGKKKNERRIRTRRARAIHHDANEHSMRRRQYFIIDAGARYYLSLATHRLIYRPASLASRAHHSHTDYSFPILFKRPAWGGWAGVERGCGCHQFPAAAF